MDSPGKDDLKMKVFQKGQVVIPVSLRRKYRIEIGDQIDVVPTSEGILLRAAQKTKDKGSLTEKLYGVFADFAAKKPSPEKADIVKATEQGFQEDWQE